MKVTMLLADAAQAAEGKLYILGGGWSVTGPAPTPSAVALYIQIPWDQTNVKHHFRLDLVDSDGQQVELEGPDGSQEPVFIDGDFEVGRPAGVKPGIPIDMPLALTIGPLPLADGSRYEWRLSIDERTDEDWRLPFSTRPST